MSALEDLSLGKTGSLSGEFSNAASYARQEFQTIGLGAAASNEQSIQVAEGRIWTPADSAYKAGVLGLPATDANKQLGLENMKKLNSSAGSGFVSGTVKLGPGQ